jgi:hypothetical protein
MWIGSGSKAITLPCMRNAGYSFFLFTIEGKKQYGFKKTSGTVAG